MRTAPQGTGIIAGGPMRAVFEMLGVQDVVIAADTANVFVQGQPPVAVGDAAAVDQGDGFGGRQRADSGGCGRGSRTPPSSS
mgnify:CR=1 FL=1